MIVRRLVASIAASTVLLAAAFARADGGSATVVALGGDTSGVMADRLRAELGARGFEVRVLESFEPADPMASGVAAVLRIESAKRRVEVWTAGGEAGTARFRTAIGGSTSDDQTIAVRASEDVRAYLGGLEAPPSPTTPAAPPADAEAPARPVPPTDVHRITLGLDAALLVPGGPTTSGAALLRARYAVTSRFAAGARVMIPIVPARVTGDAASASLAAGALGLDGYARIVGSEVDSPWQGGLAAGVALVWLSMSGSANAPLHGRREDVFTAMPYAGVELARSITPRVRARAGFLLGVAAPAVEVRFQGVPVSGWGGPLAMVSLGADLDL